MSCSNESPKIESMRCENVQLPKRVYSFKDGKCFVGSQLLGIIKRVDGNKIAVEHKNGGFADGTIYTFCVS